MKRLLSLLVPSAALAALIAVAVGAVSSAAPVRSASARPSASAASVALVTTKHSKLGTILASGSKKLTLYLFEADKGSKSKCSGACAQTWPPLLTTGTPKAGGSAKSSDLGTTTRSNGTKQVTYKGHPVYLFIKDKDDGDAYGQGLKQFGAEWYALSPSGNKVDNS